MLQISHNIKALRDTASRRLRVALANNEPLLDPVKSFVALIPTDDAHAHHYTGPVRIHLSISILQHSLFKSKLLLLDWSIFSRT